IQGLSSQDQQMRQGHVARWDFWITPLRSGTLRLRLLVSMRFRAEGEDDVVDLPAYYRDVRVAVAPIRAVAGFFSKNWQWVAGAVGAVATPLVIWKLTKTVEGKAALNHLLRWLGIG